MAELWTTTQAAEFCGGITVGRMRSLLAEAGIEPVSRQPGRSGENQYDPEAIRAFQANRGRQGERTDLKRNG